MSLQDEINRMKQANDPNGRGAMLFRDIIERKINEKANEVYKNICKEIASSIVNGTKGTNCIIISDSDIHTLIRENFNISLFPDLETDCGGSYYLHYSRSENGKVNITHSGERLFEILKGLCSNDHINVYPMVLKSYRTNNGTILKYYKLGKNPKDYSLTSLVAYFEY